ncbi:MAG: gamma-glutamylcyclotransferase [Clostridia bacterium]|nr:gamma-glutamylcyclotransferase [Clostridia bacterium]
MAYGRVRDTARRYYIAYGSNLNVQQMRYRCPSARIIGTAEVPDYRLLFKGSKTGAYLTIEPSEGQSVPVAVWEVTGDDERALDRYEGFPAFYYKAEMKLPITGIKSGKVRTRTVFVYIMHEDRQAGIPSKYYMDVCREGYDAFGFDQGKLTEALRFSEEEAKR